MMVELATLTGPAFVNPQFVIFVEDEDDGVTVWLTDGLKLRAVVGTAAEIARRLTMEVF